MWRRAKTKHFRVTAEVYVSCSTLVWKKAPRCLHLKKIWFIFFCQQTGNHGQDTHLKYHIHLCTNAGNKIIELPRRLVEPTWGQWKEIKYTDAQMFGVTTNSLFSFKNNKNTQSIIGVLNDSRWLRPIKQSKTIAPLVQWHTELLNGSFPWC